LNIILSYFIKTTTQRKTATQILKEKRKGKMERKKIMISYSSHHGSIPSFALVFVLVIVLVLVLRHDLADRTGVANRADTGVRVHTIDARAVARARDGGTVVGIEFAVAANIARAAAAGVSVDRIGT